MAYSHNKKHSAYVDAMNLIPITILPRNIRALDLPYIGSTFRKVDYHEIRQESASSVTIDAYDTSQGLSTTNTDDKISYAFKEFSIPIALSPRTDRELQMDYLYLDGSKQKRTTTVIIFDPNRNTVPLSLSTISRHPFEGEIFARPHGSMNVVHGGSTLVHPFYGFGSVQGLRDLSDGHVNLVVGFRERDYDEDVNAWVSMWFRRADVYLDKPEADMVFRDWSKTGSKINTWSTNPLDTQLFQWLEANLFELH